MIKTRITDLFGIKYPIIAGPMQWLSRAELVSAVSNAGGLGILASLSCPDRDQFRQEIKKTKGLTDKPFAVNITMLPTARPVNYEDYFNIAIEEGVKIIETSGRSPEPYMKLLKDSRVIVMHRATRTSDIRKAEQVGADVAAIVSYEAAGHPGMEDVTSMVRIPIVVDAVKIPVVAAGGIGDARGFVAALALGAEGVLMGTRFMISKECPIHPKIKEWLIQVGEAGTMMILRSFKNAERVVRTPLTEQVLEMEEKGAGIQEILPLLSGTSNRDAWASGDVTNASMTSGQVIGLIHDVPTVKEIIEGMVSEAKPVLKRLNNLGLYRGRL